MSRIEELPDDFEESLNLNQTAPNASQSNHFAQNGSGSAPALPPQLASMKSQTVDEVANYLKRTPLFMTSLDVSSADDNPELEAIRALQYEGTRGEVALNFKEQGNELTTVKRWSEAKDYYTKGLAALRAPRKDGEPSNRAEDEKECRLQEACFINRALCHLELKNYRSCTQDCASTLTLNPLNAKAHYRSSLALFSLSNLSLALDACVHGLAYHPTNPSLLALHTRILAAQKALTAKQQALQASRARAQKESLLIHASLLARKIHTRRATPKDSNSAPDLQDATIKLVPDPLDPGSTLVFPVVVLYPLHLQSDFIKAFGEDDSLAKHLDYLLPLPWDETKEYTLANAEAYLETWDGGLIKWGKKVPLLKVLSGTKVEVVDGMVRVNVLPGSTQAKGWIERLRKEKGK